jgi:hypothetical protein
MNPGILRCAVPGAILLSFLLLPCRAEAFSTGPPNLRTWCGGKGADPVCSGPACGSCAGCHDQFGDPNTGSGSVTIENLPTSYEAGVQYTLAVFLEDLTNPDFARGGFEVSALATKELCQAGDLLMDAPDTRVDTDGATGTQWLKHSAPQPASAGTAMWQFLWTAPDPAVGDVAINACANAANDGNGNQGDRIYCAEAIVPEAVPLPEPKIRLGKDPALGHVVLSWEDTAPCFGIHRGALADVAEIVTQTGDYQPVECGVDGMQAADPSLTDSGSYFYVVVANGPSGEGPYGCTDSDADGRCDAPRIPSRSSCAACP